MTRQDSGSHVAPRLVDWRRVARRLRTTVLVVGAAALTGWLVTGMAGAGFGHGSLGTWVGAWIAALFVAEVVVVGGSAVRGMLRAGDRGERLAGGDVGLVPPQVRRRRRVAR